MNSLKRAFFIVLLSVTMVGGANESKANEIPVDASITPTNQTVRPNTNVTWDVRFGGGNNSYYNFRFNYGDGGYDSGVSYDYTKRFTKQGGFSLGSGTQRTFTQTLVVSSGLTSVQRSSNVLVRR